MRDQETKYCVVCHAPHNEHYPHKPTKDYEETFIEKNKRKPTFADMCAHCDEAIVECWKHSFCDEWNKPVEAVPVKSLLNQDPEITVSATMDLRDRKQWLALITG